MDDHLFLQQLRTLDLDEACIYLQRYAVQRTDYTAIAHEIADEAFRQRDIDPFICLKLAELLIFFGEHVRHPSFHALGLKLKGDALHFVGHYQAALEALDEAGNEYLLQGDEVGWAHSRISWIPSCAWLGKTKASFDGWMPHVASTAERSKLENALEPLIDRSFEPLVSPLIPCLQPLFIDAM